MRAWRYPMSEPFDVTDHPDTVYRMAAAVREGRALQILGHRYVPEPPSECIELGAEQAHLDDLARDDADYWRLHRAKHSEYRTTAALREALDRLAAAYAFTAHEGA